MPKLVLNPNPTFPCTVKIPAHQGGEPLTLDLTFKHRTRAELDAFIASRASRKDAETIMEMASSWGLADDFNAGNVETLCQNYIAAPLEIYKAYIEQHVGTNTVTPATKN